MAPSISAPDSARRQDRGGGRAALRAPRRATLGRCTMASEPSSSWLAQLDVDRASSSSSSSSSSSRSSSRLSQTSAGLGRVRRGRVGQDRTWAAAARDRAARLAGLVSASAPRRSSNGRFVPCRADARDPAAPALPASIDVLAWLPLRPHEYACVPVAAPPSSSSSWSKRP